MIFTTGKQSLKDAADILNSFDMELPKKVPVSSKKIQMVAWKPQRDV